MASIRIHQDIYNFQRKRKGFTSRQWAAISVALGVCAGVTALIGYVLQIGYSLGLTVGLCFAFPVLFAGFAPVHNMGAEEFVMKLSELNERGNALTWEGEEVPCMGGKVGKDYAKERKKKRGFECR